MPGRPVSQNRCLKCQSPCVGEYCFRHKPAVKEYVKNYYQSHSEQIREHSKAYYQAHREDIIKRVSDRRRARKAEVRNTANPGANTENIADNVQNVKQADNMMIE